VKNGPGGRWWLAAKAHAQIHCSWKKVAGEMLETANLAEIEQAVRSEFGVRRGATQDFNALRTLVERPSQHVWVTFEDGCLWWATARDSIAINPEGETAERVTFGSTWTDRGITSLLAGGSKSAFMNCLQDRSPP
jgi:hypothetical protein